MKEVFAFILLLLVAQWVKPQSGKFIPPMTIAPAFSGTFGDLRTDHFHSGVDLRTNGQTGFEVVAVEKGFVSRIKVSPYGFGKAIYIDHPNGKTTVYAHLERYAGKIAEYVENAQYQKKSFELELFPTPTELPVQQGDIIAYSGNSGSSGGPHLHFEVRETATQRILDPFEFYTEWKNQDKTPPTINRLLIYEIDSINYLTDSLQYRVVNPTRKENTFTVPNHLKASGSVGIAIEVSDQINPISLKTGVKKIEMAVNGEKFYSIYFSKFSFDETRYANGFDGTVDSNWNGRKVFRLWVDPNNRFSGLQLAKNSGIITVEPDSFYLIQVTISDFAGNTGKLSFSLFGEKEKQGKKAQPIGLPARWNTENTFKTENYQITIPKDALFHDILFRVNESRTEKFPYPTVTVHNTRTKLFKRFSLEFNADLIEKKLQDKAYIALINGKGAEYVGSDLRNNRLMALCNRFGTYTVMVDTVNPQIIPQNLFNNANVKGLQEIRFKLIDDTGIKSYEAYIDDQWTMFEWDPKTGILSHRLKPQRVKQNQSHTIRVVVTDKLNNSSTYQAKFYW